MPMKWKCTTLNSGWHKHVTKRSMGITLMKEGLQKRSNDHSGRLLLRREQKAINDENHTIEGLNSCRKTELRPRPAIRTSDWMTITTSDSHIATWMTTNPVLMQVAVEERFGGPLHLPPLPWIGGIYLLETSLRYDVVFQYVDKLLFVLWLQH